LCRHRIPIPGCRASRSKLTIELLARTISKYPVFTPIRGADRNDFETCLFLMAHFLHRHGFLPRRPVFGGN